MSNHSTGWSTPDEQFLAQTLNEQELARLGEFVWELAVRPGKLALPPEVGETDTFPIPWPLATANFLPLGRSVRETYIRAGEPHRSRNAWHEEKLFWEAVTEAIAFLHDERKNRITFVDAEEKRSDPPPPPRAVPLDYMATFIVEGAHAPEKHTPTHQEQEARVGFALTLDPLCAKAYHVQGLLEVEKKNFHRARVSYELAMKIAALLIGPQAIALAETNQAKERNFWSASDEARTYLRARAALARLLWNKLDDPRGAAALLYGLLALDPGDHLDTHHALLCCLLEAGEIETLGMTLKHLHFDGDEDEGETIIEEDEADTTCWLYTHACYLYHLASSSGQSERALMKATMALIRAFHANSYVPQLLLAEGNLVEQSDNAESSPGTPGEAFSYATMALPGWRNTPGALQWLRETLARLEE